MVVLVRADAGDRDVLRAQLSEYLRELAAIEGVEVKEADEGAPLYPWFDRYWSDDNRIPFFIEASGAVVGFCLIRVMDYGWNVAEFGICASWRQKGFGRQSVRELASVAKRAGADLLQADVHEWNDRAYRFWTSCGFVPVNATGGVVSTRLALYAGA